MTLGDEPPGATPLEPDDLVGLIPSWVATRADLNAAEQANIEAAARWAFTGRSKVASVDDLLAPQFSDRVHRKMFEDVWTWAGKRRRRITNIGVDPSQISVQMKQALDDARFWHDHRTYPPSEIAVRLHHRLVSVHPYVNGNGRHTRFFADLYLHATGSPRLTWGGGAALGTTTVDRATYIGALRSADAGDPAPLVEFATT